METKNLFEKLERKISSGKKITADEALGVLKLPDELLPRLFALTDRVRRENFDNRVHLCSIVNAKSGVCSEDCSFCAQSVHNEAGVEQYDFQPVEELTEVYQSASELPISHFGVVTSGPELSEEEVDRVVDFLNDEGAAPDHCSSLGSLGRQQLARLKRAGLERFHHNLETAPSYFNEVCSTHSFESRRETVKNAREVGLEVCSGGLLGIGESLEQRVELACNLRDLNVDSIPLNFFVPIEGTGLESLQPAEPGGILRTIAAFRLLNPDRGVKLCAGRRHLGDLQSLIFYAGANGMMIGDLLTVEGREVEDDLRMLGDLGLEPV